jgi:hypothetical protein
MKKIYLSIVVTLMSIGACAQVTFQNHSITPDLLYINQPGYVQGIEQYNLIGSDDYLSKSPTFRFGGSADGMGMVKVGNKYMIITNHEDNYSVSRVWLNSSFTPDSADYVMNSNAGQYRLCSATLATVEEHGFSSYITCGESNANSKIHAIDPFGAKLTVATPASIATGLGQWNTENAVPLHKDAYPGKTVVVIGDDDSGTMGGGQLAMYVSTTVGNLSLNTGALYALRRTNKDRIEDNIRVNNTYPVEFVKLSTTDITTYTGTQIDQLCADSSTINFNRVEDIDYRKGSAANSREVYFTVTGSANDTLNRSYWGRVYRLILNETNPLLGTLEVILDGDLRTTTGGDRSVPNPVPLASEFMNPDNICVTKDYVYVQEDPNGYAVDIYHDARIYQYEIATKTMKILCEMNHRRNSPKYNSALNVGGAASNPNDYSYVQGNKGSWEYGAMIDISDIVNEENTFLVALQPHTWRQALYVNPDGGTVRPNENQASMLVVLRGVPKEAVVSGYNDAATLTTQFVIYPNPAEDYIMVDLPEALKNSEVKLINVSGETVFQKLAKEEVYINTTALTPGLYMVTATLENKVVSKKVIIK